MITRATSRNSQSHKEVSRPKERICDKVLRDEDEETDDEDLTIDSSSPVISNSKCYVLSCSMQGYKIIKALYLNHKNTISPFQNLLNEDTDSALEEDEMEDRTDLEDDDVEDSVSIIPETVIKFADGLLSKLPPR